MPIVISKTSPPEGQADSPKCLGTDDPIRSACASGAFSEATAAAVRAYGGEIMAFLVAVTRNEADADDAFSLFGLAVWRGLPSFRWQSSLRTWLYALARSALSRLARVRAAARREVPFTLELEAAMVAVRSTHGRSSGMQDRLARLRESLDADDRMLLVLRVNRALPWRDIARIMLGTDEPSTEDEKRMAGALRKRWQRLKEELRRELARS